MTAPNEPQGSLDGTPRTDAPTEHRLRSTDVLRLLVSWALTFVALLATACGTKDAATHFSLPVKNSQPAGITTGPDTRVRVRRGNSDDGPFANHRVPSIQEIVGTIEQRRKCRRASKRIREQRATKCAPPFVAPLTVAVQPFDTVECSVPVVPPQFRPRGIRMRGDRHRSHPAQVFEDVSEFSSQGELRLWEA